MKDIRLKFMTEEHRKIIIEKCSKKGSQGAILQNLPRIPPQINEDRFSDEEEEVLFDNYRDEDDAWDGNSDEDTPRRILGTKSLRTMNSFVRMKSKRRMLLLRGLRRMVLLPMVLLPAHTSANYRSYPVMMIRSNALEEDLVLQPVLLPKQEW